MIFGIGTDIVEIKRIEKITSLDKFAKKILSKNEYEKALEGKRHFRDA